MNTIELIKDAAFFGGHIPNERLDECRNFFDNVIEKQLTLTDVVVPKGTLVCGNCETKLKAQYHTPKGIFCKKCKDLTN